MPLYPPEPLSTERVLLRIVRRSDLPALMAVNGDPEVTKFLPYAPWRSMDDADAWLERMLGIQAAGTALQFVLVERAGGTPVGTCLLFRHDEHSQRAELGYVLGRAYWGRGYMREGLQRLLQEAFGAMSLRRIEAEVDPANVASTRLLGRLGFVHEGLLRQRWVTDGVPHDVNVYGLLSDELPRAGSGTGSPGR